MRGRGYGKKGGREGEREDEGKGVWKKGREVGRRGRGYGKKGGRV